MSTDYKNIDTATLQKVIQTKTQELIELRNELSKRLGETKPIVNYDFTSTITR